MYYGDSIADKAMMRLNAKIKKTYAQAHREMSEKLDSYTKKFEEDDKKYREMVKAGTLSQADYDKWKRGKVFTGNRWKSMISDITGQIAHADKTTERMINGERQAVFQDNVNYASYNIDKDFNFGLTFTLYDSATITRLLKEDPKLLPDVKVDEDGYRRWSKQLVSSAITQSIIQGESIPKTAKRIGEKVSSSNAKAMTRVARTAMTSAQNSGRIEAMRNARDMDIKVLKLWIATLDRRTRDAHGALDGQEAEIDEPFHSSLGDIYYPGDPDATPANVWNCRCSLGWDYPEYRNQYDKRSARNESGENEIIDDMTYDEWKNWKETGVMPVKPVAPSKPVVPPSIYDPDKYKPDKYDEEYALFENEKQRLKEEGDKERERLNKENKEVTKELNALTIVLTGIDNYSRYEKFSSEDELVKYRNQLEERSREIYDEIERIRKEWRIKRNADISEDELDRLRENYFDQRNKLTKEYDRIQGEAESLYFYSWKQVELIRKYGADKDTIQKRIDELEHQSKEIYDAIMHSNDEYIAYIDKIGRESKLYSIERIAKELQNQNVEWITPQRNPGSFNEQETINRLSGGDLTEGSCASLALCFAGQKAGYDVIDYRDGKSREEFSYNTRSLLNSVKENGGKVEITEAKSSLTAAKMAVRKMEDGKQYILVCGHHASVVRKNNTAYEYLELQSAQNSGWQNLEKYGLDETLKWRFDCKRGGKYDRGEAFLADVDDLAQNERFLKILGYINTNPDEQKKGSAGNVK